MFCPNCGYDCKDANFCPNCGTPLQEAAAPTASVSEQTIPPLNEPYYQEINGQRVDLHKLIRTYGNGLTKGSAYYILEKDYGLTKQQAKELLDPLYEAHAGEKFTYMDGLKENMKASMKGEKQNFYQKNARDKKQERKQRVAELEASGQVYCPKCLSTNVTAQKKGFGFGKAALGAAVGLDVGLLAGGIGSNKVILTCMNCGHQWKPGKK